MNTEVNKLRKITKDMKCSRSQLKTYISRKVSVACDVYMLL